MILWLRTLIAIVLVGSFLPANASIATETAADGSIRRSLTPAESKIEQARRAIEARPSSIDAHNALALALAARARETGDPSYYDAASKALKASFRIAPGDFAASRIRVWAMIGQHRFDEALELATELRDRLPDDPMVYGLLADANVELGDYAEAEEAVQWMLDLRPGNVPALTRAAHLRELFGDAEGAIELFAMAYQQVPTSESEERAWILAQLAHLYAQTGDWAAADRLSSQALEQFPDYHFAWAELVTVRRAQGRTEEALAIARALYAKAPHPENGLSVAELLDELGRNEEAAEAYARFEQDAEAESGGRDNCNRELILHYAGRGGKPAAALALAKREIRIRHDVRTLDAYAWALHANGRTAQASEQIGKALAVGWRDAELLRHAEAIASASGKSAGARVHSGKADQANPSSGSKPGPRLASPVEAGSTHDFEAAARSSALSERPMRRSGATAGRLGAGDRAREWSSWGVN